MSGQSSAFDYISNEPWTQCLVLVTLLILQLAKAGKFSPQGFQKEVLEGSDWANRLCAAGCSKQIAQWHSSTRSKVAFYTAGFPCTPYSLLGSLKRLEDENAKQLFAILNGLKESQPCATRFIMIHLVSVYWIAVSHCVDKPNLYQCEAFTRFVPWPRWGSWKMWRAWNLCWTPWSTRWKPSFQSALAKCRHLIEHILNILLYILELRVIATPAHTEGIQSLLQKLIRSLDCWSMFRTI